MFNIKIEKQINSKFIINDREKKKRNHLLNKLAKKKQNKNIYIYTEITDISIVSGPVGLINKAQLYRYIYIYTEPIKTNSARTDD